MRNTLGVGVNLTYSEGYEIKPDAKANPDLIAQAVENVSNADAAIYVGGWIHGWSDEWNDNAYDAEDVDKPDMYFPFGQDELIQVILKANPNTIIVLMGGGPADMRAWVDDAKAVLQAWYPGMEGGNAIADVIFGAVNPSGKLPITFPVKLEDSPAHSLAKMPDENLLIDHTEGIFLGYRYFDSYEVEPAYAFGHGLSYTTFDYTDLKVERNNNQVSVTLQIKNTGDRAGAEVVQFYISDVESSLERPEKELKAFEKIFLQPGATENIRIALNEDAFKFYDDKKQAWVLEPGTFDILVGSSSRDIRLGESLVW